MEQIVHCKDCGIAGTRQGLRLSRGWEYYNGLTPRSEAWAWTAEVVCPECISRILADVLVLLKAQKESDMGISVRF